jgi:hypothetical protein
MNESEKSPVEARVAAAVPVTGGHRKVDNDAQELREQAEACRRAGQHELARQLEAWATQLEYGGSKPRPGGAAAPA